MEDKSIVQQLQEVCEEMCDKYCKYPEKYTANEWETAFQGICEQCPLMKLI